MNKSKKHQIESLKASYENMLNAANDFKVAGDIRLHTEFKVAAGQLRDELAVLIAA